MSQEIAEIHAELKLDTDTAKKQLQEFASKTNKTPVKLNAAPNDKSIKKFTEAFSGGKGVKAIEDTYKGIAGGVDGLFNALKGFSASLGPVAIGLSAVLLLMKGTDTMAETSKALTNIMDKLQEAMAPTVALIGDILIPVLDAIALVIKPLARIIDAQLRPALTAIAYVIDFLEPIVNALAQALNWLADVMQNMVGWILGALGMNRTTATTGMKKSGTNSALDTWSISKDEQIAKNTSQTTSEVKNVVQELKNNGATEQEIVAKLQDLYGITQSQAQDLIKELETDNRNFMDKAVDAYTDAFDRAIVSSFTADKSKGFGGGVFTSQGRWGDGYQFGDIAGTVNDVALGLVGKGWLWEKGGTLPRFDNGGTVGAQIWGMSEAGNPEFLFNSGGYNSVINANALEDAMYNALKRAGAGTKTAELKITGQSDARQIVRWLLPALKLELKGAL